MAELTTRTLAPGSPFACLDALAGEKVETACEKAIFASPESVASATSYVAARLTLLSDIAANAGRNGATIDAAPLLRRALETDRFGFLAHVLAARDGAQDNCTALGLLGDPRQVRTNLSKATFNRVLKSYLPIWAKASEPAGATEVPQVQAAAPAAPANASGPRKIVNIDFPNRSLGFPAVDVMNPEPTGPVLGAARRRCRQSERAVRAAPASSRRSHKASRRSSRTGGRSTGRAGPQAAVEPIWPEPLPPRPAVGPAAAAPPPAQVNPVPFSQKQTQTPLQRRAGNELSRRTGDAEPRLPAARQPRR